MVGAENNNESRSGHTVGLGEGLYGGDTVVTKNPLIHTHHEDPPQDPRLYNAKCALNGSCVPHNPPDMFPSDKTRKVERSHHRHRPQH